MTLAFADGPLYFPVTAFDSEGAVDLRVTGEVLAEGLTHGPGGVFPACGTGEFSALSQREAVAVARVAVQTVDGRVPVVGGAGGAVGQAVETARALTDAGVDGILLLPPYLVGGTQEGLRAYVGAVARATPLPVVVYHRANARFTPETVVRLLNEHPNVVGFKDGIGDVALAQQIVLAAAQVRDDVQFFNGLLTAEASQAAYRAIGIPLYSSAVFAMAPTIANAYYRAYVADDTAACDALLTEFFHPLVALRDTTPGYAVSLVKAGLRLRGAAVGGVRPPLVDPSEAHLDRLRELIAIGELSLAAS